MSSLFGSPALKLKKRFQERFQEERLISAGEQGSNGDYFADPIAWTEEDEEVAEFSTNRLKKYSESSRFFAPASGDINISLADSLLSPPRVSASMGRDGSPTLLVATALVELYESPSRQQQAVTSSQEIPLNLTKRTYN